jgi:hypothetical protein
MVCVCNALAFNFAFAAAMPWRFDRFCSPGSDLCGALALMKLRQYPWRSTDRFAAIAPGV